VHVISLALVWLAVFTSGFVSFEPAPTDALMLGLVVLLPVVGLTAIRPAHLVFLMLWLAIVALGLVGIGLAVRPEQAMEYMAVSLYLVLASFVIAAFVARRPVEHVQLIFRALVAGAVIASVLGIVGYFDAIPGAKELFTRHDRASGLFKDPNVLAPFLVVPLLYIMHEMLARPLHRSLLLLAVGAVISLALLLTFSRGGWVNMAVAVVTYAYLAFVTAGTDRTRLKLVAVAALAAMMGILLLGAALESDKVADLFSQRVSLSQSYDEGPEGRFGGQLKAIALALDHPFGIGALQFGEIHHPEHPHNVYISMFLAGGWLGGLLYIVLIGATLVVGLKAVLRQRWSSPWLLVAYAALVGLVVEGIVVETDHWRVFHLVMGLVWGMAFASPAAARTARLIGPARSGLRALPYRRMRRPARIVGLTVPVPSTIVLAGARARTRPRRRPKRPARIVNGH
jgi:O-antigen ligase